MGKLLFNKDNISCKIKLNEECPFFKITKFLIPEKEHLTFFKKNPSFIVNYILSNDKKSLSDAINISHREGITKKFEGFINLNFVINNGFEFGWNQIEISCIEKNYPGFDFEIHYETRPLTIPFENPFKNFQEHLVEGGNCRILFSAPYGQGKTTFLREFFNQNEEYVPFFIFPVNYSIAKNEDIFKYIKCEILFQLLKKEVTFDKEEFSYLTTLPSFVLKNPEKLLSPFLKLLPLIGGSLFEIYDKLKELSTEYFQEHDRIQVADKDKVISYIERIYEEEGSIFEDNFYSQLIRQLIEQLNYKGKKTVLIIDDMDRMDPDHIFRVLNVFAAHFDSPEYNSNSNKFNFKKIVFVCDIQNIRRLYQHRFGLDVDFAGYIDKFFSNRIFTFNNQASIEQVITEISKYIPNNSQMTFFVVILREIFKNGNLSLRELLKFKKLDYSIIDTIRLVPNSNINKNYKLSYFPQIYLLNQIFHIDEIIKLLTICTEMANKKTQSVINYDWLTLYGIISLVDGDQTYDSKTYDFYYKNISYQIQITSVPPQTRTYFFEAGFAPNSNKTDFNSAEFFDILRQIAEKYKKFGGLQGNSLNPI